MKGRKGTKVKNKKVIVLSVLGVFVAFLAAGVFGVVTVYFGLIGYKELASTGTYGGLTAPA